VKIFLKKLLNQAFFILSILFIFPVIIYGNTKEDIAAIKEFNKTYSRTSSRVMMRVVHKSTLANLDYAAYNDNILMNSPKPEADLKSINFSLKHLNSLLNSSIKEQFEETSLSEKSLSSPMAWIPMLDYLAEWDYDASLDLQKVGSEISSQKWGNQNVFVPLQEISTAYLHESGNKTEFWVKLEFQPWVPFSDSIDDEDKDGFPELYGKIDESKYPDKLISRLKNDYLSRTLTASEIDDYFYELSSDWYEKYNTDTLDMKINRPWPNSQTEPEIIEELGGITIQNATAIIKGKPHGKPIYNVFLVESGKSPENSNSITSHSIDNMTANIQRWEYELQEWGNGSWENWEQKLSDFYQDIHDKLTGIPKERKGIIGKDGFLFFRGSLEYIISGDLQEQENNPYPAIVDYYQKLKEKNIDMLFVIIPAKPEIFPDKISANSPENGKPYVTPYTRKFLLELAKAGVETIDLLPAFIEERGKSNEPIYMTQDTHWSNRAVKIAAKMIGNRIKKYSWYPEICKSPVNYKTQKADFVRAGDIRGMLPENEKIEYRPMKLTAEQVLNPDGSYYEDDKSSPIVLLGDSFCGVFHFEDCKHAGISAHIAKEIGMPVDLIMAHGSGPQIRKRFARRGTDEIKKKKLLIWTTAARDLYNYWTDWEMVVVP